MYFRSGFKAEVFFCFFLSRSIFCYEVGHWPRPPGRNTPFSLIVTESSEHKIITLFDMLALLCDGQQLS